MLSLFGGPVSINTRDDTLNIVCRKALDFFSNTAVIIAKNDGVNIHMRSKLLC